jgi:hypothetical protein
VIDLQQQRQGGVLQGAPVPPLAIEETLDGDLAAAVLRQGGVGVEVF